MRRRAGGLGLATAAGSQRAPMFAPASAVALVALAVVLLPEGMAVCTEEDIPPTNQTGIIPGAFFS